VRFDEDRLAIHCDFSQGLLFSANMHQAFNKLMIFANNEPKKSQDMDSIPVRLKSQGKSVEGQDNKTYNQSS